jgi:hypothetical protein
MVVRGMGLEIYRFKGKLSTRRLEADAATGGVDRRGTIFPIIKIVTETGVETVTDDKLSRVIQTQGA